MLTDEELLEVTRPPEIDEPCPDDVRAEILPILRRVEAAVRADVAAEVRASKPMPLAYAALQVCDEREISARSRFFDPDHAGAAAEAIARRIEKAGAP